MNIANPELNTAILTVLKHVGAPLAADTLLKEVAINLDRPSLTTQDFTDAIRFLEARDLVSRDISLLGRPLFSITSLGKEALRGA